MLKACVHVLAVLVVLAALAVPSPAAGQETRYTFIFAGNKAGTAVTRVLPDGERVFTFEFNDRGRGPSLTTREVVDEQGVPVRVEITGHDYWKNPVDERYDLKNGKAEWHNASEKQAPLAAARPSFYLTMNGTPQEIELLEERLAALDLPTADQPGAGAGGGIGAMLMALGAAARPGAQLVLDEVGFDAELGGSDFCITAEGRIDRQTLRGKTVAAVVSRCAADGVPVAAVGGQIDIDPGELDAVLLQQGDLERAGAELARRFTSASPNGG